MNREQLAHVLRAAATVVEDGDILVVGSHAVLATYEANELPEEATMSVEADVAFWDDPDETKADRVDVRLANTRRSTISSATTAKASVRWIRFGRWSILGRHRAFRGSFNMQWRSLSTTWPGGGRSWPRVFATGGALSDEERAWADAILHGSEASSSAA